MQHVSDNAIAYYRFESLAASDGVTHGVFTRLGGASGGVWASLNLSQSTGDDVSAVRENRRRMFSALGASTTTSVTSWLVHGNHIRVIDDETFALPDYNDVHADGMVTRTAGIMLTMRYADCVPVLLFDPVKRAVGIAHAGWLGIVRGVIPAIVAKMVGAFRSNPAQICACIGPSIGPGAFEVGADVAEKIQSAVHDPVIDSGGNRAGANGVPPDRPFVNLWRAAQSQLHTAGVAEIETASLCTASNTHEWFSHRAEKGKTGRFGIAIGIQSFEGQV